MRKYRLDVCALLARLLPSRRPLATRGVAWSIAAGLCVEKNVPLVDVPDNKSLGEWAGLCKIDKDGRSDAAIGCMRARSHRTGAIRTHNFFARPWRGDP